MKSLLRCDDLDWLAIFEGKGRAQRLMTPHQFIEGFFQSAAIELSFKHSGTNHVVDAARFVEQPRAVICVKQRRQKMFRAEFADNLLKAISLPNGKSQIVFRRGERDDGVNLREVGVGRRSCQQLELLAAIVRVAIE